MESSRPELDAHELRLIVSRATGYHSNFFTIEEHSVEKFSTSLDGFLADHYALQVVFRRKDAVPDGDGKLSFFVKCLPHGNNALMDYLTDIGTFRKEMALFEEVLPRMQRLLGGKQFVARSLLMRGQELIVMENLKIGGYDIVKGNNGIFGESYVKRALEALANLHAGSLLLERSEGKSLVDMFPGVLDENAWTGVKGSIRTRDVENVIRFWCEVMKLTEKNHKRLSVVLSDLPKVMRKIYELVRPSELFPNVLSHGDLWSNNLMFRVVNGVPEQCMLVDFQMSRYTPPAYDINLLLSLTTSSEFRKKYAKMLSDHYFECIQNILRSFNVSLQKESFDKSCAFYRSAGLIHSCIILPEVLLPQEYLREVFAAKDSSCGFMPTAKVTICLKAFQENFKYRQHLLESIGELIDTEIF